MSLTSLLPLQSSPRVSLAQVPTWWDGESLYGWCSRLHTLEGGKTADLGLLLFGRKHASRVVDLPVGLDRFVAATGGRLGGIEQILRTRTVIAAYWPYLDAMSRENIVEAAMDVKGTSVLQLLGLSASRLDSSHPLRSCSECRREQQRDMGYATWQLAQQLPGAWWCCRHHRPLEQAKGDRMVWRKPGGDEISLGYPLDESESHALELMDALARAITDISEARSESLASACLRRLRELGLIASPARLNRSRVKRWLEEQPILQWIRRQGDAIKFPAGNWAVLMLRGRSREQPLKWMVLWTCLWADEPLERAVTAFNESARGQLAIQRGDQFRLWPEKDKVIRAVLPESVERAFNSNQTIRGVVESLDVSERTIRQWMADHPEFAIAWAEKVRRSRLTRTKDRMNALLETCPEISRSELLLHCAKEVAWLRSNAPRTLRRILDRLPSARSLQGELFVR